MPHWLNEILNGPAHYTVRHHFDSGLTLVFVLGILVAEFIAVYLIGLIIFKVIQNAHSWVSWIMRRFGVGKVNLPQTFLELTFPGDITKSAYATEQLHILLRSLVGYLGFWDRLAARKKPYSLELVGTHDDGIRFVLMIPTFAVDTVQHNLLSFMPGLKIKPITDYLGALNDVPIDVFELKLGSDFVLPLQSHKALSEHDPIAYLTGQMTKLVSNNLVAFQIVVVPLFKATHSRVLRRQRKIEARIALNQELFSELVKQRTPQGYIWWLIWYPPCWFLMAMGKIVAAIGGIIDSAFSREHDLPEFMKSDRGNNMSINPYELELGKIVKEKLDQHLFEVTMRILVASPDTDTITNRLNAIADSFKPFTGTYQSLQVRQNVPFLLSGKQQLSNFRRRVLSPHHLSQPTILSSSELSDLYHFPFGDSLQTEGMVKSYAKTLAAPLSMKVGADRGSFSIVLGVNQHHGSITPIGLTAKEREKHVYIVGGTGNGKTTMIEGAVLQDIIAGRGVAVIDPHGDMAQELISCMPKSRIKDVVYFDPYDISHPIGLNLLELPDDLSPDDLAHQKDFVMEAIISIFRKVFSEDDSGGHRIEATMRNAILTAFTVPNATLFTIYDLLTDPNFRKGVVDKLDNKRLMQYWNGKISKAGNMQLVKMTDGVTTKLERFNASEAIRRVIEQPKSTLDFDDIINSGKILICKFSSGAVGNDTAELFGITVLAKLQLAAKRRIHIKPDERKPFYLYVDEFQNFATLTFVELLAEARKFKLYLTMAEQSTAQQEEQRIIHIILDNVGTIICFRFGSPASEELLLPLFKPWLAPGEISKLSSYNFYMSVKAEQTTEPLSGETTRLADEGSDVIASQVIASSRQQFATTYVSPEPNRSAANDSTSVKPITKSPVIKRKAVGREHRNKPKRVKVTKPV